jgi:beta-glucanase (GH16 family)
MNRVMLAFAGLLAITLLAAPASASTQAEGPAASASRVVTGDLDPSPYACGTRIRKPDLSYWTCRFVEHFSGSSLDRSSWAVHQGSNNGSTLATRFVCALDDPDNIRVVAGKLRLTVRREAEPFACEDDRAQEPFQAEYSAATISQLEKLEVTFARVEVRAKFSTAQVAGVHSAIWMYPEIESYGLWPLSGEIDIAEFYSVYPDRAFPFVHYRRDPGDPVSNNFCKLNPRLFHKYVLEWTPGQIKILYDGRVCLTHRINAADPLTGSAPFDQPFHLILTQTLGIGQNPFKPGSTPLPQIMEIDWVKIWI